MACYLPCPARFQHSVYQRVCVGSGSPFRFSQMNHEYKRVPDKHQLGNLLKVFERSHGRGKAIEKAFRRWGMPDCPVVVLANHHLRRDYFCQIFFFYSYVKVRSLI